MTLQTLPRRCLGRSMRNIVAKDLRRRWKSWWRIGGRKDSLRNWNPEVLWPLPRVGGHLRGAKPVYGPSLWLPHARLHLLSMCLHFQTCCVAAASMVCHVTVASLLRHCFQRFSLSKYWFWHFTIYNLCMVMRYYRIFYNLLPSLLKKLST